MSDERHVRALVPRGMSRTITEATPTGRIWLGFRREGAGERRLGDHGDMGSR
jgi:hypothetical protein